MGLFYNLEPGSPERNPPFHSSMGIVLSLATAAPKCRGRMVRGTGNVVCDTNLIFRDFALVF